MQPSLPFEPEIVFVRHPRARRYLIRVEDDGRVRVTVPRWGSKKEGAAFAERERAWIEKQRDRAQRERARPKPEGVPKEIERAMRIRAKRELPPRLLELAARHGLTVTRVSVRNQRWRWGSCSRSGHICLNWRLAQMPDTVRDYVMLHELMHLKRMDHSARFWRLVENVCPDFRASRAYLRETSKAGLQWARAMAGPSLEPCVPSTEPRATSTEPQSRAARQQSSGRARRARKEIPVGVLRDLRGQARRNHGTNALVVR